MLKEKQLHVYCIVSIDGLKFRKKCVFNVLQFVEVLKLVQIQDRTLDKQFCTICFSIHFLLLSAHKSVDSIIFL